MQNTIPMKHIYFDLINIVNIPSNTKNSDSSAVSSAVLYVFEHNEAVIKMTIRGRRPTMRHVSRTLRVALDWLFDRINLDPKFKSVTLTQTPTRRHVDWRKFYTWWVDQSSSFGVIWAPLAAPRNSAWQAAPQWRRGFKIKKKKKELSPIRDQQWWLCLLILLRQVPPPHRVRLHLKVRDVDSVGETR